VVGMFFFDDNTYLLRHGDPMGERLGRIAREQGMLLMLCDQCAIERELADGKVVYLHCHYGIGRTGITLASYLIRRGSSVDAALAALRAIRKGPEGPQQVAFLARFAFEAGGRSRD
jgi:hypothetical protein